MARYVSFLAIFGYPQMEGVLAEIPFGQMLASSTLAGARFVRMDLADKESIDKLFAEEKFDKVVNLAITYIFFRKFL